MHQMMIVFICVLGAVFTTTLGQHATQQNGHQKQNEPWRQNVWGNYPYNGQYGNPYHGAYYGAQPYGYPYYRNYWPYNYGINRPAAPAPPVPAAPAAPQAVYTPAPAPQAPAHHVPVPQTQVYPPPGHQAPVYHAPVPSQVYHGGLVFIGKFEGTCEDEADGLYYIDERSFAYCTGGRKTIQACAGGSANPDYSHFKAGERYQHYEFCSINLAAQLN